MVEEFKKHIHFEEGMDDSMLSLYLSSAERYVEIAVGHKTEYMVLIVAGIMYDYRASDWQLKEALDAITPFLIQEVFAGGEETVSDETD